MVIGHRVTLNRTDELSQIITVKFAFCFNNWYILRDAQWFQVDFTTVHPDHQLRGESLADSKLISDHFFYPTDRPGF